MRHSFQSIFQRRAPSWALFALFVLFVSASVSFAWIPRKPILYGVANRPFPTIFRVDYQLCRAEAWLNALAKAEKSLPDTANIRQTGIRGALARKAAASMLFPVDVVTPSHADSDVIRVFLKNSGNNSLKIDKFAADPFPLLVRMCLVWETANACAELRKNWPDSVDAARVCMEKLESQANFLERLWQKLHHPDASISSHADSVGMLMDQAMRQPGSPGSAADAEKALQILLQREISPQGESHAALWNYLAAYALYLRAIHEESLGQPGLAETDCTVALARLKKGGFPDCLVTQVLLTRAALRRMLRNIAGMCVDYVEACSRGQCQGLANARRSGQCRENMP